MICIDEQSELQIQNSPQMIVEKFSELFRAEMGGSRNCACSLQCTLPEKMNFEYRDAAHGY